MKILAYSALNSVTQDTIKTLVFRKNTQDKQQVREIMAAVLTAPANKKAPFVGVFLLAKVRRRRTLEKESSTTSARRTGVRRSLKAISAVNGAKWSNLSAPAKNKSHPFGCF